MKMKRKFILSVLLFGFLQFPAKSQTMPATESEFDSLYKINIRLSKINGVYIPKSMEDAFERLNRLSPPESIQKFKMAEEETVCKKLHFGLGRWIIVNWNFYEGSRFSHFLKGKGLLHPDDMAQFVLRTYHRYLNSQDLNEEELIKYFAAERKAKVEEMKKKLDSKQ